MLLPASTAVESCRSSWALAELTFEMTTGMADPFSLTVQLRLGATEELMASEKLRVSAWSLMNALLSLGGWVSLLVFSVF